MKVLVCKPGLRAEIKEIGDDDMSINSEIGSAFLNTAYPFEDHVMLFCADDFSGLVPNRSLRKADNYDRSFVFYGTIVITGMKWYEDGWGAGSLSDEQAEKYRKMLDMPDYPWR